MSNQSVKNVLWWICLLVAPAVLLAIELFHPAGFTKTPGMYQYLSKPEPYDAQFEALGYFGPNWWFTMHMIQTPMVGLVAVGLWLMVDRIDDADGTIAAAIAWLSRAATFVFLIYYTVLDAIGGIGLGRSILQLETLQANGMSPDQASGAMTLLNALWQDEWAGGVNSYISLTGSWAAFAAASLVALALLLARRAPWPPLIVLVGFGWELQERHAMLNGPIAFGLLIVASVWLWWSWRRTEQQSRAGAIPLRNGA
jgi:hypothetical protein